MIHRVLKRVSQPKRSLKSVVSSVLMSGKILDFQSPFGANSAYTTTIRGPQVSCSKQVREIQDANFVYASHSADYGFNVSWINESNYSNRNLLRITSKEKRQWHKVPGQKDSRSYDVWKFTGNETVLECRPTLAQLVLDIKYVEGIRYITYKTEDVESFKLEPYYNITYGYQNNQSRFNSPEIDLQTAQMREGVRTWNIWALLDAAMLALEFTCKGDPQFGPSENGDSLGSCSEKGELQAVAFCRNGVLTVIVDLPFTDMFFSDQQRQNDTDPRETKPIRGKDLNITETTINEYLAMTAISALSLNAGETSVPVNITTYQATYTFSDQINFFLPYSLSLVACLLCVGVGVWSWTYNGASAVDGGFLQVMTATRGRTQMEDLVVAQHIDNDNVPEELLDLEVRYGELLNARGVGIGVAGFGTVEETKLLKKGWCPV
jgi:hypothetical protein